MYLLPRSNAIKILLLDQVRLPTNLTTKGKERIKIGQKNNPIMVLKVRKSH